VEVDGSQRFDDENDLVRTSLLEASGFRVLRFWNNEVINEMDGVLAAIFSALNPSPPQPSP
jgi:very-short-patch-repair endonuclease